MKIVDLLIETLMRAAMMIVRVMKRKCSKTDVSTVRCVRLPMFSHSYRWSYCLVGLCQGL